MTHTISEQHILKAQAEEAADAVLIDLPEWRLEDLYPARDSDALTADLKKAMSEAEAFEGRWKGKLADAAASDDHNGLGAAVRDFEKLEELLGRR